MDLNISELTSCELNNYCIFQGVTTDLFRCENNGTQCSADAYNSRLDGTFICNYHLGKYFKIKKSRYEIPSGAENCRNDSTRDRSFKMLIGQSLLPQRTTNRILIPVKHEAHFNTSSRSPMERFVLYTIYDDKENEKKFCDELVKQEYFEQPLWLRFQFNLNTIMGMVNPSSILCRNMATPYETRTFSNQGIVDEFPPFLKNLIYRLVRPIHMVIGGNVIKLEDTNTCNFVTEGLQVPALHNPNKPMRLETVMQPKFSMRTVVEFDGIATMEQRSLDMYDDVVLTRPLLNGRQENTQTA
ncbi:vp39 [Matsumuraeses phaseoli granulovirus]|uniref:Vp39 n=1 Tax=Matsumuraeses phaseoli granulovirus TaxID=2760664 RepID=A0AAE7MLF3_9BBAC|nr:vp39 [Matsumuraeses phaseoli granulovirus]QOD40050.1 vp39 [Matsumuraeses phaseoli granulovirus]